MVQVAVVEAQQRLPELQQRPSTRAKRSKSGTDNGQTYRAGP